MKKALLLFLALALVGSAAFAEISDFLSIGSWGRVLWDIAGTNGDDIESTLHQSWGGAAPRTAISASGEADNVTFALDIFADGAGEGALGIGDNAYIEIRPGSWGAILVGKSDINETRSDAAFGIYNWDRIGSANSDIIDQEGFIFDDLLDVDGGVSIRLYPIDGLTIGVAVSLDYSDADNEDLDFSDPDSWESFPLDTKNIANIWGNANIYVGYELPNNIGKVRLGFDAKYDADAAESSVNWEYPGFWGVIGAAFEFTMVDNLYVAVGAKIPTQGLDKSNLSSYPIQFDYLEFFQINAYASYSFGDILPLTIHALFGSKLMTFDQSTMDTDGFGFQIGLGADYEVIDNVPIFVDVRFANNIYMAANSDAEHCWTFGAGVSKLWANAELGIAFIGATGGYGNGSGYHANDDGDFTWAIPVKFEYSF